MKRILSFLLLVTLFLHALPAFGMSKLFQRAAQPVSRYLNRAQKQSMPSIAQQLRPTLAQAQKSPLFTQRAFMSTNTHDQSHQQSYDKKQEQKHEQSNQQEKSHSWKDYFYDTAQRAKEFARNIVSNRSAQLAASFGTGIGIKGLIDTYGLPFSLGIRPEAYVVNCVTQEDFKAACELACKAELGSREISAFYMWPGLKIIKLSDGTLVGYCLYRMCTPEKGYIKYLAVDSALQKKGYGRLLIQEVLEELRSKGAKEVQLSSLYEARGFYERIGFEASPELSSVYIYKF